MKNRKKEEYTDGRVNMRWCACQQIIKFWRKQNPDSQYTEKGRDNVSKMAAPNGLSLNTIEVRGT